MISKNDKDRMISELSSLLEEDASISLRIARRISSLIKMVEMMDETENDQKTISGSPTLSPGTITIQMNGIPDQDGEIEGTLRKIVFETVNEIIERRSDPDVVEKRKSAYEIAQKYRDDEEPEGDII